MARPVDFLFDSNGDLYFRDGDFVAGESTLQHQHDILLAEKGDFTQSPLLGVGIMRELNNSVGEEDLRLLIQREMEGDGMRVHRLRIDGLLTTGTIDLEATYG